MRSQPDPQLRVGGLVPFSTVDFPGRLAAVVFCQGCPWICRYCHNPHLRPFDAGTVSWREIAAFLEIRRGLLDAVVFSGGEPTAQRDLVPAMKFARDLGFEIGLHTAGIFPFRLRQALDHTDWVGLDIKAPWSDYERTTGRPATGRAVEESLRILVASGIDYELRTTVHPALLDDSARHRIRCQIDTLGAQPTRWQNFRPTGCIDAELLESAGER